MKTFIAISLFLILSVISENLIAQNTFPSTGRVGIYTTSPAASLQVKGGARFGTLANYVNIDSATGNLSFVGTSAYQVGGNKYAFQYSGNPNYGLFFNSSSVQYEFRNGSAVPVFSVNANTGNSIFNGTLKIGAYTLPATDGTSGQTLTTNGAGSVSWSTVSGGGASQWTTSGSNIYYNIGNVGIGNSTPSLGGLVVDKKIGAANAVFGSNTTGVSIESANPGISFNGYYNNGRKSIVGGFVGGVTMDPATGSINIYNSPAATTSAGAATATSTWLTIDKTGTMIVPGEIFNTGGIASVVENAYAIQAFASGTHPVIYAENTGTTGPAAEFSVDGSGPALITDFGNVGIGNPTPTSGGLVVDTKVGAVNAMFGSNITGVAIESNYPGVGLNTYYNGGRKFIANGFGGLISLDPTSGLMGFYNSATSGTTAGTASLSADLAIAASGSVGIGTTTPTTGGLVVNTKVGNANAIFGSNTTGVAIESANPGIGLNTYYNGGRKFIAAGYGGVIGLDPATGLFGIYNSATSGSAGGTVSPPADFVITAAGNAGVGTIAPSLGGLVVDKKVGAANAVFGSNTTGVAIESANPGIGLNTYYNNGRKFIAAGYGAVIGLDPASGLLGFYNTSLSGSAGATSNVNANLVVTAAGNVGIGITTPSNKLDVCGTIRAKEVLVQTGWCDYVFADNYKLRSLSEVEEYINSNKHLPDVPAATEVEDKGVKVAQMDSILIKKVEELTLYMIDQNKQIQQLQQKITQLESKDADKKKY